MKQTHIVKTIALFFGLVFSYAAVSQLLHHASFSSHIGQLPLLSSLSAIVSWLIPIAELGIVLMLCSSRWRFAGLFGVFSFLLFSTWCIAISIFFSIYLPCSCGGIISAMTRNQHLAFDGICVLLAAAAVLLYPPAFYIKQTQDELHNLGTV